MKQIYRNQQNLVTSPNQIKQMVCEELDVLFEASGIVSRPDRDPMNRTY